MAETQLDGFDFYEHNEKGSTAAQMSFIRGIKDVSGNFRAMNLLKRDAAYRRGSGHSEIFSFRFVPITVYKLNNKTEDLAKYLSLITQVKANRYSMQMFPKSTIIESDAVSRTEAMLEGGGDAERGLVARMGSQDFAQAAVAAETNENNNTFLGALRTKHIVINRWDGGVSDDLQDETVDLPLYTQYKCPNAWMEISDFGRIRAQLQNNLADTPELVRPFKLLVSPDQYENIIEHNEKLQDSDFARSSGLLETGKLPVIRGFTVEAHPQVRNDEAFAYIPKVTIAVSDWGTFTDVKSDANVWTVSTARRQYNYDCKLVEPLSIIQISFTGATANTPIGTPGSSTGDGIFDKVRDPKEVLKVGG